MLGTIIQKYRKDNCVNALFMNIMQFISPFYDENSRGSIYLKYKKVNVGK